MWQRGRESRGREGRVRGEGKGKEGREGEMKHPPHTRPPSRLSDARHPSPTFQNVTADHRKRADVIDLS